MDTDMGDHRSQHLPFQKDSDFRSRFPRVSCWHLQTPKPVWLEEEVLETTGYLGQESSLVYSRLGFHYLWSQPKQNTFELVCLQAVVRN